MRRRVPEAVRGALVAASAVSKTRHIRAGGGGQDALDGLGLDPSLLEDLLEQDGVVPRGVELVVLDERGGEPGMRREEVRREARVVEPRRVALG